MMQPDDYDPNQTVWGAVEELEQKAFTKQEIYDELTRVAANLRPEDGYER